MFDLSLKCNELKQSVLEYKRCKIVCNLSFSCLLCCLYKLYCKFYATRIIRGLIARLLRSFEIAGGLLPKDLTFFKKQKQKLFKMLSFVTKRNA